MTSPELRARYVAHRARGVRAASALSWARSQTAGGRVSWDWTRDDRAVGELEGFELELRADVDEYPDLSCLGSFTDRAEVGALEVPGWSWNRYRFFVPGVSIEEHRRGLSAMGYGRHDAWATARGYARTDMRRLLEGVSLYIVTVTASRAGVELGEASIGGVDVGEGLEGVDAREQVEAVAEDLVSEVLEEARGALERLGAR